MPPQVGAPNAISGIRRYRRVDDASAGTGICIYGSAPRLGCPLKVVPHVVFEIVVEAEVFS